MSWLLFLDESGHDHRTMPYEVRGGIAVHARQLWPLVCDLHLLEVDCFGDRLHRYQKEVKGAKLLDRKRMKWAQQAGPFPDEARRKHCLAFLNKGANRHKPSRDEFTAYGQACERMATGIFGVLRNREAVLFAAAVPRSVNRPDTHQANEFLRKDQVFLLERYFYFLEAKREPGLLVMDETEATDDRRFVRRLEAYFQKTRPGLQRSEWIVPTPFFVSSEMTHPVQAADVCIYCINWGFRLPRQGMDAPVRDEIARSFGTLIGQLQFCGKGHRDGATFQTFGIVYVPDPYSGRNSA